MLMKLEFSRQIFGKYFNINFVRIRPVMQSENTAWPLKMGPVGCSETSVTTNLRCVIFQKSENLIYSTAEAWNHRLQLHLKTQSVPRS